jgi:integrase
MRPGAVSTHYSRFVAKLGIATTFHKLRHYTATDLIVAGVDVRTVAGRLGHANAGTTLKIYTAWVSEADQRAGAILDARIPAPASRAPAPGGRGPTVAEKVAELVRMSIQQGRFEPGEHLPTMKDLARSHQVSINAAHAAINLLAEEGYLTVSRGKRSTVTDPECWPRLSEAADASEQAVAEVSSGTSGAPRAATTEAQTVIDRCALVPDEVGLVAAQATGSGTAAREAVDLEVVHLGQRLRTYRTQADPSNPDELLQLLLDAVRRTGGQKGDVQDYKLVVRYAGERGVVTTFIAPPHLLRAAGETAA